MDYNKECGIIKGKECFTSVSVSFHYITKASMVWHLQALMYKCNGGRQYDGGAGTAGSDLDGRCAASREQKSPVRSSIDVNFDKYPL